MDFWTEEVKRTLITQDAKAKDAQGMIKELESAVKELQSVQERRRKEQLLQAQEIAGLKSRLDEASDAKHLKALAGEFKKFTKESKYDHPDVSTIEPLQRVLHNMQNQLTAEQKKWEEKVKNCMLPSARRKFELELEKIKVKSQQVAQLQEQLQSSWKEHRATQEQARLELQQDFESVVAEHTDRLKALEIDVGELKSWAEKTKQRLHSLESEESPFHQKIQELQVRVEDWMKQVLEGRSPPAPLSPAALEEIRKDCQEQKQQGEEAIQLGDDDGEIAKDLAKIEEKLKVLETIEHSLNDLTTRLRCVESEVKSVHQRLEDTQQRIDQHGPHYALGKRLLLFRSIMLDLLKDEKSRPEHISEDQFCLNKQFGKEISAELDCYIAPNGRESPHISVVTPLQAWVEREFLGSAVRVLLLQGPGGSGKSTFNRYLMRQLWLDPAWESFQPGASAPRAWLPFFIPLGSDRINPREELFKTLTALPELIEDFTEAEINLLKKEYHVLWIADAYDEMAGNLKVNLYDINALDQYDGRVKLLISHRSDSAPVLTKAAENTYMMPKGRCDTASMSLYRSFYVAPFNAEQIDAYIVQYLQKHPDNEWKDVADYRRQFTRIPDIESLVSTPFLLLVAVESLPNIIKQVEVEEKRKQASSSASTTKPEDLKITMTRKLLLDGFVQGWFSRQIEKAYQNKTFLEDPGAIITDEVIERWQKEEKCQERCLRRAFAVFCMEFARNLRQGSRTSVIYPPEQKREGLGRSSLTMSSSPLLPKAEIPEWVKEFFDDHRDVSICRLEGKPLPQDMKLCRQGSPLRTRTLTGSSVQFEFIHALLIDYFLSVHELENHSALTQSKTSTPIPTPLSLVGTASLSDGHGDVKPAALSLGLKSHPPLREQSGGPKLPSPLKSLSGAGAHTLLGSSLVAGRGHPPLLPGDRGQSLASQPPAS